MAISPNRISTATQYDGLQQTGAASSRCIEALDKMFTHPLCRRVDPEKVSTFYIVDSFHSITIQNSEYMKNMLVQQITDAYKEAGWKDAYVDIEYREQEYINNRKEPLTLSVHSLRVELTFMQPEDYVAQEADEKAAETVPDNRIWSATGAFRVITEEPTSVQQEFSPASGTGECMWMVMSEEKAKELGETILKYAAPDPLVAPSSTAVDPSGNTMTVNSSDTVATFTTTASSKAPDEMVATDVYINGSRLSVRAGQTIVIKVEEQLPEDRI